MSAEASEVLARLRALYVEEWKRVGIGRFGWSSQGAAFALIGEAIEGGVTTAEMEGAVQGWITEHAAEFGWEPVHE